MNVKIKPLEWTASVYRGQHLWDTTNLFVGHYIIALTDEGYELTRGVNGESRCGTYATLDEAQVAAHDDLEQRVSAIVNRVVEPTEAIWYEDQPTAYSGGLERLFKGGAE